MRRLIPDKSTPRYEDEDISNGHGDGNRPPENDVLPQPLRFDRNAIFRRQPIRPRQKMDIAGQEAGKRALNQPDGDPTVRELRPEKRQGQDARQGEKQSRQRGFDFPRGGLGENEQGGDEEDRTAAQGDRIPVGVDPGAESDVRRQAGVDVRDPRHGDGKRERVEAGDLESEPGVLGHRRFGGQRRQGADPDAAAAPG